MPTIEALEGHNTKTLIALGGATIHPNQVIEDLTIKLMYAADYLSKPENLLLETAKVILNNPTLAMTHLLPVAIGKDITQRGLDYIAESMPEDIYYDYLEKLDNQRTTDEVLIDLSRHDVLDTLTATKTQLIVNLYGSEDILAKLKINGTAIGGFREEMGGFDADNEERTLINIEILGASHTDYTRPSEIPSPNPGFIDMGKNLFYDKEWNETVSAFVARVVANSQTNDALKAFLSSPDLRPYASFDVDQQRWIIKLPGWKNRA